MKTARKIIALLMLLAMALGMAACTGGNQPTDTEAGDTSAEQTEPEKKFLVFDTKKIYCKLLRPDDAGSALTKSYQTLRKRFSNYFGKDIPLDTDFCPTWKEVDNSNVEILVGLTNRDASKEFYDRLPEKGYGFCVTEDKIVILGKDDSLTGYAVTAFDNQILLPLAKKAEVLELPVGTEEIFTFSGDTTTLQGLLKAGKPVMATLRDVVKIGQYGSFPTSQGAASDGTYYYVALKKKVDTKETDVIVKYDIASGKRVAVSEELPLDHCNDMAYNYVKKELIVPNMVGKTMTIIDPETLTIKKSFSADNLPGTPYAVAYSVKMDCYVILAGGQVNFVDPDTFTVKRSFPMISMNYTGQGVDCDDNYVFIPMSQKPDAGTKDNVIVVYNIETGSVVAQIHIDDSIEIETMINYGGVYYAHFNHSGSLIYRLQFDSYSN